MFTWILIIGMAVIGGFWVKTRRQRKNKTTYVPGQLGKRRRQAAREGPPRAGLGARTRCPLGPCCRRRSPTRTASRQGGRMSMPLLNLPLK